MKKEALSCARRMQHVLRQLEPKLSGADKRLVQAVLSAAERDIPKQIGKQIKFDPAAVQKVVDKCGGDKIKAAKKLGCSLRTIYTALNRKKRKR